MEGKICKIKGCKKVLNKTEGQICQMHRTRFHRYKDYNYISPNWAYLKKGQALISPLGYLRININGKRVLHHRYIMEQHLGRKLTNKERIHHKNGIKTDNRIENLELFVNHSEHMKKYHPDICEKRKINPKYTPEKIANILNRLTEPSKSYSTCFCGRKIISRNLCSRHLHWAYKHKFT